MADITKALNVVRKLSPSGFFSRAAEAAQEIPQAKGTPEQMRKMLLDRKGVKPEELRWTGFDEWAKGKKSVTRDEITEFLRRNEVQVGEKTLSGDVKTIQSRIDGLENTRQNRNWTDAEEAEYRRLVNILNDDNAPIPKFSEYTLPGGENYRELLLTRPRVDKTIPELEAEMGFTRPLTNEQQDAVIARWKQYTPESADYRSSHWDEPNPIAHMRMKERVDPEGRRVLHLEELQSDWAQEGRKTGFDTPEKAQKIAAMREEERKLQARYNDLRLQQLEIQPKSYFVGDPLEYPEGYSHELAARLSREMRETQNEIDAIRRNMPGPGVPSAPFVESTPGWTNLALRRAMIEAARGNFDAIAWTPGREQAKRYDLSQHVREIEYIPNGDGTYRLGVTSMQGEGVPLPNAARMTLEDIERSVGKEIAEKIKSGEGRQYRGHEGRTLEGLDLQVGGQGMVGYYDKILPTQISKVLKDIGETPQFGTTRVSPPGSNQPIDAPSFNITPEMREKINQGLPLFTMMPAAIGLGAAQMQERAPVEGSNPAVEPQTTEPERREFQGGGRTEMDDYTLFSRYRFLPYGQSYAPDSGGRFKRDEMRIREMERAQKLAQELTQGLAFRGSPIEPAPVTSAKFSNRVPPQRVPPQRIPPLSAPIAVGPGRIGEEPAPSEPAAPATPAVSAAPAAARQESPVERAMAVVRNVPRAAYEMVASPVATAQNVAKKIFSGDNYQSTGEPVTSNGRVNWGDPDSAADFFRADAALQELRPYREEGFAGGGKAVKSVIDEALTFIRKARPEQMRRAREQGFDTRKMYLHGTQTSPEEIKPNFYISRDPEIADIYARRGEHLLPEGEIPEGAAVMPVLIKKGAAIPGRPLTGYFSVRDPSDVRSVFAEFDPLKKDSSNIMSSAATAAAALGAASQYEGNADYASGGHVEHALRLIQDEYPTQYLPNVGRQVMADGGDIQDKDYFSQLYESKKLFDRPLPSLSYNTDREEISVGPARENLFQKHYEEMKESKRPYVSGKTTMPFLGGNLSFQGSYMPERGVPKKSFGAELEYKFADGGRAIDVARQVMADGGDTMAGFMPPTAAEMPAAVRRDDAYLDALIEASRPRPQSDADIQTYQRQMRERADMPENIRSMTHAPSKPLRPVEIEGGFTGKRQLGEVPYDVAGPLSGMAQTAYSLKTLPFYFTPAMPLAAASDVVEAGIDTKNALQKGDYLSAALSGGLGVGLGMLPFHKQIGSAVGSAVNTARDVLGRVPAPVAAGAAGAAAMTPTEAEAVKFRVPKGVTQLLAGTPENEAMNARALEIARRATSEFVPRNLTLQEIRRTFDPQAGAGMSGDDLARLVNAYGKVASPASLDPELAMRGREIAQSYITKGGSGFGGRSYFGQKPSTPLEELGRVAEPIPYTHKPKPIVEKSWEKVGRERAGSPLISLGGDLSDLVRLRAYGPAGNLRALARPSDIHAGFDYMLEPNLHSVWSNNLEHAAQLEKKVLDQAVKKDLPVMAIANPMGPASIDSSKNMMDLYLSAVEGGVIPSDALKLANKYIQSGAFGGSPKEKAKLKDVLAGFPGFEDVDKAREFLLNNPKIAGTTRGAIIKGMERKDWVKQGFPEVGQLRVAATSPKFMMAPGNMMGGRMVELDPRMFHKAEENRYFKHFTYGGDTPGTYYADVPLVHRQYGAPDVTDMLLAKYNQERPGATRSAPPKPAITVHPFSVDPRGRDTWRKMFEEQRMVQEINDRMMQSIRRGEQRRDKYGFNLGGSVSHRAMMIAKELGSSPRETVTS